METGDRGFTMDILHEELTNRDFNEILSLEGQSIRARRRSAGIKIVGDEQSERPVDLFGVVHGGNQGEIPRQSG